MWSWRGGFGGLFWWRFNQPHVTCTGHQHDSKLKKSKLGGGSHHCETGEGITAHVAAHAEAAHAGHHHHQQQHAAVEGGGGGEERERRGGERRREGHSSKEMGRGLKLKQQVGGRFTSLRDGGRDHSTCCSAR